eukprot:scaffold337_cov172-Amphora_coffeaeformis.AAC.13
MDNATAYLWGLVRTFDRERISVSDNAWKGTVIKNSLHVGNSTSQLTCFCQGLLCLSSYCSTSAYGEQSERKTTTSMNMESSVGFVMRWLSAQKGNELETLVRWGKKYDELGAITAQYYTATGSLLGDDVARIAFRVLEDFGVFRLSSQ